MKKQPSGLVAQSRQGNADAIAQLLNQVLAPQKFKVRVIRAQQKLTIFVDGQEAPPQDSLVAIIWRGVRDLELESIDNLKVYGRKQGESSPHWSVDVDLKHNCLIDPLTSNRDGAGKGISLDQLKAQTQLLWKTVKTTRPNKWIVISSTGCLMLVLLGYGGHASADLLRDRSTQAKLIQQAQALLSEAEAAPDSDVGELKAVTRRLKEARDLLRGVPNVPGARYAQARAELEKVRAQLKVLEQQITSEEGIARDWNAANESARQAIASVNDPPYPLDTWKTAQEQLDQAIQKLEAIPEGTSITEQVQAKLTEYRQRRDALAQTLASEEKATQALQTAENTALRAMEVTAGQYQFEVAELQSAQALWQQAIAQLREVPAESYAFQEVNSRMAIYTRNSGRVSDGIKEIQSCLATRSSLGLDFCKRVYLSLSNPSSRSRSY